VTESMSVHVVVSVRLGCHEGRGAQEGDCGKLHCVLDGEISQRLYVNGRIQV